MGLKGMRMTKTASDYFIAGRRLSMWVFILAATATSFSGWTFMGHPGLVFRDGFQYAYASFYAITIPFTGVMFLKRQWMLGKRFGYVTPGEMLSDYYQGDGIRILTVIVALLFSIPYLGVQLGASGFLFNVLSDNIVSRDLGMWILSFVVLVYVASGGLRAVAYVDTVQCILLAGGIIVTGIIALNVIGGWEALNTGFGEMATAQTAEGGWVNRWAGGEYNSYFAIPGVIQFTAGLGQETPVGGLWTGIMCLTYMFALMGIQSAPAFSMWAFGNADPRPFAPQQVWASAFVIGGILFFFTAFQGMGAHLLGANPLVNAHPDLWQQVVERGGAQERTLDQLVDMATGGGGDGDGGGGNLETALASDSLFRQELENDQIIALIGDGPLAEQREGRPSRDPSAARRRHSGCEHPRRGDPVLPGRAGGCLQRSRQPGSVLLQPDCRCRAVAGRPARRVRAGGHAIDRCRLHVDGRLHADPRPLQAVPEPNRLARNPEVLRSCRRRVHRRVGPGGGDVLVGRPGPARRSGGRLRLPDVGVVGGYLLVPVAHPTGCDAGAGGRPARCHLHRELRAACCSAWWASRPGVGGPGPFTRPAWGMIFNLGVALIVSAATQDTEARAHRMKFHAFLNEHSSLSDDKKKLVPIAWIVTIAWMIFGIGPGAVIGNDIFGAPNDPTSWTFGIPSIWAWQILFWVLGVIMLWFLAYRMEMSTVPNKEIEALLDDIGDAAARQPGAARGK